jgi:hypothetical protein
MCKRMATTIFHKFVHEFVILSQHVSLTYVLKVGILILSTLLHEVIILVFNEHVITMQYPSTSIATCLYTITTTIEFRRGTT